MLRRAACSSATAAAVVGRSYHSSYQKPVTGTAMNAPLIDSHEKIPVSNLRYDLLGPRRLTHIRPGLMLPAKKALAVNTLNSIGEPALRWVEDPKNWAELNKADWEDAKKNDNKFYVMPRMSQ